MPAKTRARWLFSLRVKLLAVLLPLIVISMLLALVGLSRFLHGFFQRRAESETAQMGEVVKSALRQSMLKKPTQSFSDVLADVQKAAAEADRLVSLGARRVDWDSYPDDPDFVVLADPEGNIFCIVDVSHDRL